MPISYGEASPSASPSFDRALDNRAAEFQHPGMGLFSASKMDRTEPPQLETINYRNGVVEFRIPASWKEEYSDTNGGAIYEARPDSGTLRIKLITVTTPKDVNSETAVDLLKSLRQAQGRTEAMPNGNAVATAEQSSVERGQQIKTFYWFLANPIPPTNARLATFSYTILEAHEQSPAVARELRMLNDEIRAAEFSKEIGSPTCRY